jgi:phosphoglycolate phosphatase
MTSFPFDIVGFDLDGTLADTAPDLTAALNHALVALGREPVPAPSVRSMVGHGARALLAKGITATGEFREELVDEGFPIFLAYYEAHIADDSQPFPGVVAALDALAARGVKVAICTNKLEHLARRFVTAIGWDGRFAAIVGGDTTPSAKPNPEPLLAMVEQAGGGRAAFVGD